MFNLFYTEKSSLKGTIRFTKERNPRYSGVGVYTDIDGQRWDIKCVFGPIICATKLEELHPYYNDTSGFRSYGVVRQTWKPYKMEIV